MKTIAYIARPNYEKNLQSNITMNYLISQNRLGNDLIMQDDNYTAFVLLESNNTFHQHIIL